MFERFLEYDKELLLYLNGSGSDIYDVIWIYITNISSWIPLFVIFLLLVLKSYPKKEAWLIVAFIVSALLLNLVFTEIVKELVGRVRPNNDPAINSMIHILKTPANYSFFSGHASSSFVVTTLVVLFLRRKFKLIYLSFLWPLLFCFSRIYVGVHYPSDIFAGIFVGLLFGFGFFRLYNLTRPKFNLK